MRYRFGADVGGTAVKLGLFDETNALIERMELPTRRDAIVQDIAAAVADCLRRRSLDTAQVDGIGIGMPGQVNDEGWVLCCANLGWENYPLCRELGALTGLPVRLGNDANLAALGEYASGGGRGCHSMIFVTLGTGVGGGIVLDGKVLGGAHGLGGEIGHITVSAPDRVPCPCGKRGCVEQYASANGIVRVMKERLSACDAPSVLRRCESLTSREILEAAKSGDRFAEETLDRIFDYLGEALASAACVCDPQRIVLGGGVSKAGDYLLRRVEQHFKAHMFNACKTTEFALATLGNDAGMFGAARLMA